MVTEDRIFDIDRTPAPQPAPVRLAAARTPPPPPDRPTAHRPACHSKRQQQQQLWYAICPALLEDRHHQDAGQEFVGRIAGDDDVRASGPDGRQQANEPAAASRQRKSNIKLELFKIK